MGSSLRRPPHMAEEQVLGLLSSSPRVWSAYEIAEQLTQSQFRVAPAQIYRALARLCARGRARRIESLNAYAGANGQGSVSLLCRQCHSCDATDGEGLAAAMKANAHEAGFEVERLVLEVLGLCARCRKGAGI